MRSVVNPAPGATVARNDRGAARVAPRLVVELRSAAEVEPEVVLIAVPRVVVARVELALLLLLRRVVNCLVRCRGVDGAHDGLDQRVDGDVPADIRRGAERRLAVAILLLQRLGRADERDAHEHAHRFNLARLHCVVQRRAPIVVLQLQCVAKDAPLGVGRIDVLRRDVARVAEEPVRGGGRGAAQHRLHAARTCVAARQNQRARTLDV